MFEKELIKGHSKCFTRQKQYQWGVLILRVKIKILSSNSENISLKTDTWIGLILLIKTDIQWKSLQSWS